MRAPSVRVGRNRRRAYVYLPLFLLGAALIFAVVPTFNAAYLGGVIFLISGAAGFVIETGPHK